MAPALAEDFSEIAKAVKFFRPYSPPSLEYGDKQFNEDRFFFADPAVFEVFSFKLIRGNPETVLQDPNSMVITAAMARKYFGDEDPIGKTLVSKILWNETAFKVTGVLSDVPEPSHFKCDFLAPFDSKHNLWYQMHAQDWSIALTWTYLLLSDREAANTLQSQFRNFVQKHFPEAARSVASLHLQPLTDIHLHSHMKGEIEVNGNPVYIYVFSAIAGLVLLIACINFMNLATARSAGRAKEVGMRKVLGAYRSHLNRQFLGEAMLLSFAAVLLAIGLVELFLPLFNALVGKALVVHYFGNGVLLSAVVGIGFFAGMTAGSYPAFFLSAFEPVQVLKGASNPGAGNISLRRMLVIGQFAVAMILLIGVMVISNQLEYMRNKELGFNKEQILVVRSRPHSVNYGILRNELLHNDNVLSVAGTSEVPGSGRTPVRQNYFHFEGMAENQRTQMSHIFVDYDFIKTLELRLVEGRDFSREFPGDAQEEGFILTEAAAKELGWKESPLGKAATLYFDLEGDSYRTGRVIGVLKDFHFESLHNQVKPLVLTLRANELQGFIMLRIRPNDMAGTLVFVKEKWQELAQEWPFEFFFLDEDLAGLYQREERLRQLVRYFAALAILIACLGLFGLAAFAAEQRTKEIGPAFPFIILKEGRGKVLGASITGIVGLLSKEFVKLVVIAAVIASPIAYFVMNAWLQDFAYRIDIGWWMFVLAGGMALVIALLTVSAQALKAALANPVEALRYE